MLRIVLLLIFIAGGACAGPWPQPAGTGHLCFSLEGKASDGSELYGTLYTEWGIGRDRTLGLDLGQSEDELDKAVLFLRWPLGREADESGEARFAWEMGLGLVRGEAALRPGFSLGKGILFGRNAGWISLDTRGAVFGKSGDMLLESDLTVGAQTPQGNKWMVQLQMGAPSDRSPYVKIAPSYAFRQGDGRHLLLGATAGLVGTDTVKITLGLWQAF